MTHEAMRLLIFVLLGFCIGVLVGYFWCDKVYLMSTEKMIREGRLKVHSDQFKNQVEWNKSPE